MSRRVTVTYFMNNAYPSRDSFYHDAGQCGVPKVTPTASWGWPRLRRDCPWHLHLPNCQGPGSANSGPARSNQNSGSVFPCIFPSRQNRVMRVHGAYMVHAFWCGEQCSQSVASTFLFPKPCSILQPAAKKLPGRRQKPGTITSATPLTGLETIRPHFFNA